jgi:Fe-S cluster assembly protein SufB
MKTETTAINIDRGKGDFSYPEAHVRDAGAGLSERTIHYIADVKEDPGLGARFSSARFEDILGETAPHALGKQGTRGHRL